MISCFYAFSIYFQNTQIVIENPRSSETENETKFIIDFDFGLNENSEFSHSQSHLPPHQRIIVSWHF